MCEICGCTKYVRQLTEGKKVVVNRAIEIVQKLGLTASNMELFEDGEYICGLLGPKVSLTPEAAEIWDVVQTVHRFQEEAHHEERKKALEAAKDVFGHLPTQGTLKETVSLYHQLAQLQRELTDADLDAFDDPVMREVIRSLRKAHTNGAQRKTDLAQKYGL